jgi:AraC family transcriptional regulator
MEAFESFSNFYQSGPYQPYIRSFRPIGHTSVCVTELSQPGGEFPDPAIPEFSLQLVTGGGPTADISFGGHRLVNQMGAGSMCLAPPDTNSQYLIEAPHTLLVISIPKRSLVSSEEKSQLSQQFEPLHQNFFRSERVMDRMRRLHFLACQQRFGTSIATDEAVLDLTDALCHAAGSVDLRRSTSKKLSTASLNNVFKLIEERLDEDLLLDDLATVAGRSPWHFARAFKAEIGQSPHQYLLQRRIDRARDLLAHSKESLIDVAMKCGFASQSHMGDVFRQRLGVSPAQYRQIVSI